MRQDERNEDTTHERASRVRLVLLDVDGVLTDGRLYYGAGGEELKAFDARDGQAIRLGQLGGLRFGLLSGRHSAAVTARARELDIDEVHQRVADKAERLAEILRRLELAAEAVCYVGDDLIDVPVLRRVGLAVAPADAMPEAHAAAHWVTSRGGGRGAVREVVELVLHATGRLDQVLARYRG